MLRPPQRNFGSRGRHLGFGALKTMTSFLHLVTSEDHQVSITVNVAPPPSDRRTDARTRTDRLPYHHVRARVRVHRPCVASVRVRLGQ